MDIFGNGVIDWWIIGLVVSLVLVLIALAGLWLWKLMGPKLRFSLPVVLFLLMAGVATVEAQKAGRGNAPPRLPQVGESVDDAQNRSSGVLQNGESLDCDRFTEINVMTNGVSLTLHRPETHALETVEVTVAGSTNLVAATWEAYTNVVFAAGVTNVEVFISREMMAAHSVSNVNFFAFIQSGDSDGDGLDDWHERFNLKTDPFMADTDYDVIPDGLDHRPLEVDWPVSTDDGHLVCWTLWNTNAVPVVGTVGEVVYERTFAVSRTSRWQQYFLSSADDEGAGWPLAGAALEWSDSSGGSGTISMPSIGDSFRIPLPSTADTLTIAVRVTDPMTFAVPPQLHLLGYAPEVTVRGTEVWTREVEHRHVSSKVGDFTDSLSDDCGCSSGGCLCAT